MTKAVEVDPLSPEALAAAEAADDEKRRQASVILCPECGHDKRVATDEDIMNESRLKLLESIRGGEISAKELLAIYQQSAKIEEARLLSKGKERELAAGPAELRKKAAAALAGSGLSLVVNE